MRFIKSGTEILNNKIADLNLTENQHIQLIGRFRYECRQFIQIRGLRDLNQLDLTHSKANALEIETDIINRLNDSLRQDNNLLQCLTDLQTAYHDMYEQIQYIRSQMVRILTSLDNGTYDVIRRRCCPTFLDLMDKYLF